MRLALASCLAVALALPACTTPSSDEPATHEGDLSLGTARSGAVVVPLANGRFLLVGGTSKLGAALASTEIVDPAADTSTPGPTLALARVEHTATLLADGRVLVAGGKGTKGAETSAEILDLANGTTSAAAALPYDVASHTATRLADGRVFLAGGFNQYGGAYPFTAIYDPNANTWTKGPSLLVARGLHTATALPDGSVLLAGGRGTGLRGATGTPNGALERFVPQTNAIVSAGSLVEHRAGHTASLLADGSVLFTGGDGEDGATDSAEILRPGARVATRVAPMGVARRGHEARVAQGRVVVVGGTSDARDSESTYQIFDVAAGTWSVPLDLATARIAGAPLLAGGSLYVCGGSVKNDADASCEKLALPASPAVVADLPHGKKVRLDRRVTGGPTFDALRQNGRLGQYVWDDAHEQLLMLSVMRNDSDPQSTFTWDGTGFTEVAGAAASPSPSRRGFAYASDRARGKVVLFGGERRSKFNLADTWEWNGTSWTNVSPPAGAPAPSPRVNAQMTFDTKNNKVLLYGGANNATTLNDLWSWDGTAWTELAQVAATKPPVGYGAGNVFTFDESRGVAVLVAGTTIWEWNGSDWRSAGGAPGEAPVAAYDPTRGGVLLMGSWNTCTTPGRGEPGSTFQVWNGTGTVSLDYRSNTPAGCTGTPFGTFDRKRERLVLGGMWEVNTTWPIAELTTDVVPNRAPRITDVTQAPVGPVYAGAEVTLSLKGTDPDEQPLRWFAVSLPSGATLDETQGIVRWTPRPDQAGAAKVVVGVTDGVRRATREVTLNVSHFASSLFPSGKIELRADVKWKGSSRDCDRRGCRTHQGDTGYAQCAVQGENPGRVTITCNGQTSWAYIYDSWNTTWNTLYESLNGTTGEVQANGSWSAGGGTRTGAFSMSGTIKKDAQGDLELCVGGVEYKTNSDASYAGEGCAPLYPYP